MPLHADMLLLLPPKENMVAVSCEGTGSVRGRVELSQAGSGAQIKGRWQS